MPVAPGLVRRTILLKGKLNEKHDERRAGGTITPGHLIDKASAGTVVVHPTAGGVAEAIFAKEDALQGRTIDDNYSSGELVFYHEAQKGDVVQAWLAAGITGTPATKLTSNGDGTLRVVSGTERAIATLEESLTTTGSAARCVVRII